MKRDLNPNIILTWKIKRFVSTHIMLSVMILPSLGVSLCVIEFENPIK